MNVEILVYFDRNVEKIKFIIDVSLVGLGVVFI